MTYLLVILSLLTGAYIVSICYVIYGFVKLRNTTKFDSRLTETRNKVSVIIPVRNEEDNILNCLLSLEKNKDVEQVDFEIVVVNDHSTDKTLNVVKTFIENSKKDVSLYNLNDTTSKKEALKFGITKAKYNIIATTDADCILHVEAA